MTSTLPWHQSVTALRQSTILSGSYEALRRSVCSIVLGAGLEIVGLNFCPSAAEVSRLWRRKRLGNCRLGPVWNPPSAADIRTVAPHSLDSGTLLGRSLTRCAA